MEIHDACYVNPMGPVLDRDWSPGTSNSNFPVTWRGDDSANPLEYFPGNGLGLSDFAPFAPAVDILAPFPWFAEAELANFVNRITYEGTIQFDPEGGSGGLQDFMHFMVNTLSGTAIDLSFNVRHSDNQLEFYLAGELVYAAPGPLCQYKVEYRETPINDDEVTTRLSLLVDNAAELVIDGTREIDFRIEGFQIWMSPLTMESGTGSNPYYIKYINANINSKPAGARRQMEVAFVLKNGAAPASVQALTARHGADKADKLNASRIYSLKSVTLKKKV